MDADQPIVEVDEVAFLKSQLAEADRRAGAAERRLADLQDSQNKRNQWLAKAKADAGFSNLVSFDRVWEVALPALLAARDQPPAIDAMPVLDNGLNTVIEGALEITRKHDPGRQGLIFNLIRLQEWLDLYVERARRSPDPRDAWDWLTSQKTLEVFYHRPNYGDDDDFDEEWRVTRRSGSVNDREWEIIGRGLSPTLAIEDARATVEGERK